MNERNSFGIIHLMGTLHEYNHRKASARIGLGDSGYDASFGLCDGRARTVVAQLRHVWHHRAW